MKHFSFDAGQRENRNVNNGDNGNAKEHRVADLFAGGEHGVETFLGGEAAAELVLAYPKLAHDVFNNYDCAVDDQPEINRAQTHQVARYSGL